MELTAALAVAVAVAVAVAAGPIPSVGPCGEYVDPNWEQQQQQLLGQEAEEEVPELCDDTRPAN